MAQMGFFDVEKRYAALDAKHDPLVKINAVVAWEAFRSRLEKVWRKPADKRKSNAGCKAWDAIVMFKAIVLRALYNLSDDQVEYQRRDRLSFVRFLALALEDKVPDAKTVRLYREQLSQAGVIDALFNDFDGYLKTQGYQAMGGQIIDASIVAVPKQRNNRADNAQIKQGETPKEWADKAARRRQCQRHGEMSRFRQDKMSHFLHVKRLQPGLLPRSSLALLLLHRDTEHPRLAPGLEPVALALDVDRCRVV